MASMITVSRQVVAWLVADHLNQLSSDEPGCSNCCAPCAAIMELAAHGILDQALADFGPGYDWWGSAASMVDRTWLTAHIKPFHIDILGGVKEHCTMPDAMSVSFAP